MKDPAGFETVYEKGVHITFENGYTVSVQWGSSNYCANRDYESRDWTKAGHCPNAEMAAWDSTGKWHRGKGWSEDVHGHNSPAEVLAFMQEVANLPCFTTPS